MHPAIDSSSAPGKNTDGGSVIQRVRRIACISQAFPLLWSVTVVAASGSMAHDMICDQICDAPGVGLNIDTITMPSSVSHPSARSNISRGWSASQRDSFNHRVEPLGRVPVIHAATSNRASGIDSASARWTASTEKSMPV